MSQKIGTNLPINGQGLAARLVERFWWPLCALVIALQIALIWTHEPFADEWQALQIARQSPGIAGLFENLSYESHPPLWYLFLAGLSAIVGPYLALKTASLILGLLTQWIIFCKSPFPKYARLLIALSGPILFEFITISRGHTLGLALIFLALLWWRKERLLWVVIALLPAVDFFYGVFSICLIGLKLLDDDFLKNCRLWWPGAAMWLVVSMVAAFSIIPAEDYIPVYGASNSSFAHFKAALLNFSVVYWPMQGSFDALNWNGQPPGLIGWVGWAALLASMGIITRGAWPERVMLFGMFGLMLVFTACLFPLQNRHLFLLSIMIIVALWRRVQSGEKLSIFVNVWLVLGAACGIWTSYSALTQTFDRSRDIAQYIRDENLGGAHWAAVPDMAGQGVSALIHIPMERLGGECMQQFIRWNSNRDLEIVDFENWVAEAAGQRGQFYVLSTFALELPEDSSELMRFAPSLDGKPYYIYEIGTSEPPARLNLPDCAAGQSKFSASPKM